MAKQFASRLAWISFATASMRGVISAADFQGTIQSALLVSAAFYGLGLVLGELARRLVEENVEAELAGWKHDDAALKS